MAIIKPEQLGSGSYSISGSFSGSFQGAHLGTSSYATNALSSSYAATASYAPLYLPLTGGTITDTGSVSLPQANGSTNGYLSSTDWTAFNAKQNTSEKGQEMAMHHLMHSLK